MRNSNGLSLKEQILISRSIDDVEGFCNPKIKHLMPDPKLLIDIDKLIHTIASSKFIGIFGDYDVDGITSVAIWKRFLDEVGVRHCTYIPNRAQGYGASSDGIRFLIEHGVDMILFVDCGSNSKELLESIPVPVGVIDHHQTSNIPQVAAVVNPHRVDASNQDVYKQACSAGLSFIVVTRLAKLFGYDMCMSLLDLVALATIADIMPMTGFNKACVRRGLELLNNRSNKGVSQLSDFLGIKFPITATQLAFYIIPCLNAAGRISCADLSLKILLSNDAHECHFLAQTLAALNNQRKLLEEDMSRSAFLQVEEDSPFISVRDGSWHPGIVGIVASRLKENFNKTSFVFYRSGELWKGSARSHGCDVGKMIARSVEVGLASQGGGHAAAGGVTIPDSRIDEWEIWMGDKIAQLPVEPATTKVDAIVSEREILSCDLSEFGPFGNCNPLPKVLLPNMWLRSVSEGPRFVKCTVHSGRTFVGFRITQSMLHSLKRSCGRYVDLLVGLDESGSVKLEDARLSE